MKGKSPTRVVVLTPPGRSAVAVVLVEGPHAVAAVDACFRAANGKALERQPIDRIVFGRWRTNDGGPGEELIVCRTSPSSTEVHCHGGRAAVGAVQAALIEEGCVATDWREWTPSKDSLDTESTTIAAEARIALAECVTEGAAAILLDQLNGALEDELRRVIAALDNGATDEAQRRLGELSERTSLGRRLTTPWRVVLAGAVNVGKSSLINALVGYERAVVYDEPGVTRDVVTTAAAIAGWPVQLTDTAGLRQPTGEIEAAGIEIARQAIAQADVVVLVEAFEPGAQSTQFADDLPALCRELGLSTAVGDSALWIANKADLAAPASGPAAAPLFVSALTGDGIATLVDAIGQRLVPTPPPPGAAMVFTPRQADALNRASTAIAQNEAAAAQAALQALLADNT